MLPGPQELLVIAIVVLLVVGPDRLPEVARNTARFLARFRSEAQRGLDEFKRAADMEDLDRELRGISRELDETKRAVTRPLGGGRGTRPGAAGAVRGPAPRAADDPPPFDPDAT